MAQPRGYNPTKHSSLPYVDKEYKDLLDQIADKTGRSRKKAVEMAIADSAIINKVSK
jgi:hypothetical protein